MARRSPKCSIRWRARPSGRMWEIPANHRVRFPSTFPNRGEQTLLVRGVDRAGVATGTAFLTVIYDATAPEVAISAMKRGRIVGTAKDTWLKGWTLSWKKASAGEDAWKEFKKGTRAVTEGELGILDLTGAEFAEGTDYQVKLEVTAAGPETAAKQPIPSKRTARKHISGFSRLPLPSNDRSGSRILRVRPLPCPRTQRSWS